MHDTLDRLIEEYRAAQDVGVRTLLRDLGVPQPSSGGDWWLYCSKNGLYNSNQLGGIPIYAHGYGIELKIGSLTIDFDWGPSGEPDGFDGWRLYKFSLDNLAAIKCSHSEVNAWLEDALANGELIKVGSLYFDPNRRS